MSLRDTNAVASRISEIDLQRVADDLVAVKEAIRYHHLVPEDYTILPGADEAVGHLRRAASQVDKLQGFVHATSTALSRLVEGAYDGDIPIPFTRKHLLDHNLDWNKANPLIVESARMIDTVLADADRWDAEGDPTVRALFTRQREAALSASQAAKWLLDNVRAP